MNSGRGILDLFFIFLTTNWHLTSTFVTFAKTLTKTLKTWQH